MSFLFWHPPVECNQSHGVGPNYPTLWFWMQAFTGGRPSDHSPSPSPSPSSPFLPLPLFLSLPLLSLPFPIFLFLSLPLLFFVPPHFYLSLPSSTNPMQQESKRRRGLCVDWPMVYTCWEKGEGPIRHVSLNRVHSWFTLQALHCIVSTLVS